METTLTTLQLIVHYVNNLAVIARSICNMRLKVLKLWKIIKWSSEIRVLSVWKVTAKTSLTKRYSHNIIVHA